MLLSVSIIFRRTLSLPLPYTSNDISYSRLATSLPLQNALIFTILMVLLRPQALVLGLLASTTLGYNFTNIYRGLRLDQSKSGVLQIAFNNSDSEINVWSQDALTGLTDIVAKLKDDNETKAVLFTSDVPKYFLSHLDLLIQPFGENTPMFQHISEPR